MRKTDREKFIRKYGREGKVIFFRSPRDCNLATVTRDTDERGNIILYALLKKRKKKRVRMIKIIRKERDLCEEVAEEFRKYL